MPTSSDLRGVGCVDVHPWPCSRDGVSPSRGPTWLWWLVRFVWALTDDAEGAAFTGPAGRDVGLGAIGDAGGCARRSHEVGQDRDLSQFCWAISAQLLDDAAPELVSSRREVVHVSGCTLGMRRPQHLRCWATAHFGGHSGGVLLRGFLADSCCRTKPNGTPAKGP